LPCHEGPPSPLGLAFDDDMAANSPPDGPEKAPIAILKPMNY
jgi:hypothetical protein